MEIEPNTTKEFSVYKFNANTEAEQSFREEMVSTIDFILTDTKVDLDYSIKKIENYIEWLIETPLFQEKTKYYILEFIRQKKFETISQNRILRYFATFKGSFKLYEPDFNQELTQKHVEEMYLQYMKSSWQQSTKVTNWKIMILFFKFINDKIDYKKYKFKENIEELEHSKLLRPDSIELLLQSCENITEKVIVSILWDSGCRAEELLTLSWSNFKMVEDGQKPFVYVTFKGKTGTRFIPLYWSYDLLKKFIEEKAHQDLPFINQYGLSFTRKNLEKFLNRIKIHSNLNKRLYPHLFRHSRATFLANHLTDRQMCFYFGWSKTSKMPARYSHLSGYDLKNIMQEVNYQFPPSS